MGLPHRHTQRQAEDRRWLIEAHGLAPEEAAALVALALARRRDPRLLAARAPHLLVELGWPFARLEEVARRAGASQTARIQAALLCALDELCAQGGHTAVPELELLARTARLMDLPRRAPGVLLLRTSLEGALARGLLQAEAHPAERWIAPGALHHAERQILVRLAQPTDFTPPRSVL